MRACERACKRTGEPSVPCCERGGTTARVTDFSIKKNRNGAKSVPTWWRYGDSNPRPVTCEATALPTELYPRNVGARDRNRTGTTFNGRRILSPVRLPVPPLGLTTRYRISHFFLFVNSLVRKNCPFAYQGAVFYSKSFISKCHGSRFLNGVLNFFLRTPFSSR